MHDLVIVGHQASALARSLANQIEAHYVPYTQQFFADSEASVLIPDIQKIKQKPVVVIFQYETGTSRSVNDQLAVLCCCVDKLRMAGARSITLLLPYMPYARQNEDEMGIQGLFFTLGRCLQVIGVKEIFVCDVHHIKGSENFGVPLHNISLKHLWVQCIKDALVASHNLQDFCIVSPDEGGLGRAQDVAELLNVPVAYIHKQRVAADVAVAYKLEGDVVGKNIILIDDIVDTGRTVASAGELLKKHGAQKIFGCFSHALLTDGACERLKSVGFERIVCTNTVGHVDKPSLCTIMPIDTYLAQTLQDRLRQTTIF